MANLHLSEANLPPIRRGSTAQEDVAKYSGGLCTLMDDWLPFGSRVMESDFDIFYFRLLGALSWYIINEFLNSIHDTKIRTKNRLIV